MTWKHSLAGVALALLTCANAAAAAAEPEYAVELATGSGRTFGGEHYDESFSASYKLSLRGLRYLDVDFGDSSAWRLAGEAALDVTQMDWAQPSGLGLYRVRALVGVRLELRVASGVILLGRALAGLDHERSSDASFIGPGEPTGLMTFHERGVALAAELGLGARVDVGPYQLGVQCGLPVAFYGSVDHVEQPGLPEAFLPAGPFMSDTAVDVELLATLGMSF
jgi:hypothetical protein